MEESNMNYDFFISGGGIAGLTTTIGLLSLVSKGLN
jgi:anaerobic glycerol-3-phosphate dehydrogenase